MIRHSLNVQSLLTFELQTFTDKLLTLIRYYPLLSIRKVHCIGSQHYPLLQNPQLSHRVPKRLLSVEHLKIDYSDAPDIYFGRDECLLLLKALGRQVPVCAYSL